MTTPAPQPAVSVIVAVYKAEAYLKRCVDSLLAQTFVDFEILLIDDGSPDRSGEMCDDYARQDRRVRVIHKENGGVSSARQCGLDNARGEYVIHADPDDWAEPEMLEEMYRKAKEEDADMVICDYYIDFKHATKRACQRPSDLSSETVMRELFQQLHGSCWNKLVRRACYKEHGVRFPQELSYCEDLFVNVCLVTKGIRIAYLPAAYYHYDQDMNSDSLVCKPMEFLQRQGYLLLGLFEKNLPANLFPIIKIYYMSQRLWMDLTTNNISYDFESRYNLVRKKLKILRIPKKRKVVYALAFYISPHCAQLAYKIWGFLLSVTKGRKLYSQK